MNTLPAEVNCHILQFLPGKDVSRLTRVSKGFSQLIARNRGKFAKPTVKVMICENTYDQDDYFYRYKIFAKKKTFSVDVGDNDEVFLDSDMDYLKEYFIKGPGAENKHQSHLFFTWLFKKADISCLQISKNEDWVHMAYVMSLILANAGGRCHEVLMKTRFKQETCELYKGDMFPEWSMYQRQMGVPMKFKFATNTFHGIVNVFYSAATLNYYSNFFEDVVCEFSSSKVFDIMGGCLGQWLISGFENQCFTHNQFQIRLTFDKKSKLEKRNVSHLLNYFENHLELHNMTEKELKDVSLKKSQFPISVSFKNSVQGEILTFFIEKFVTYFTMSIDIKPMP